MENLRSLLIKGHKIKGEENKVKAEAERGRLRGGSVGYLDLDGLIRGSCARNATMRYFGVNSPVDMSTDLMFQAGELSEEAVLDVLRRSWPGGLCTQKEYPVNWEVEGIPVTGSPDIILIDDTGKGVLGIEKKLVCAYNTAKQVGPWPEASPKFVHVAQAIFYGTRLDIPFCLLYASRVNWDIPFYHKTKYDIENPSINSSVDKKTGDLVARKIRPFYSIFYLEVIDDLVYYRHEGQSDITATDITVSGIEEYYAMVANCVKNKEMPDRYHWDGMEFWDAYSEKYNDFYDLHEAYDNNTLSFEDFLQQAKERG